MIIFGDGCQGYWPGGFESPRVRCPIGNETACKGCDHLHPHKIDGPFCSNKPVKGCPDCVPITKKYTKFDFLSEEDMEI